MVSECHWLPPVVALIDLLITCTYGQVQRSAEFSVTRNTFIGNSELIQYKASSAEEKIPKLSCTCLCLKWNNCQRVSWRTDQSECTMHSVFGVKLLSETTGTTDWVMLEKGECWETGNIMIKGA